MQKIKKVGSEKKNWKSQNVGNQKKGKNQKKKEIKNSRKPEKVGNQKKWKIGKRRLSEKE